MDSVSTTATFATATEGGHDEDDEDGGMPRDILQWGNSPRTAPGPTHDVWPTPPTSSARAQSRGLPVNSTGLPTPSQSPTDPRQQQQQYQPLPYHPANTEILMASLITLADPSFTIPAGPGAFADVDKDLVIALLRAVGATCSGILKTDQRGELYESRLSRRKLDAARAVLEGVVGIDDDEEED